MKIAVIAANGRSGWAFVDAALAAGHEIYAGVRGAHTFVESPMLHIMPCDATNPQDVTALIADAQVVVSLIGHVRGAPSDVQTKATETIVRAMKAVGIERFISLTGTGVRLPGDHVTIIDRILNAGISIIDPARVRDGKRHAAVLQASDIDWTILRVLKLQNIPARGMRLTPHGPTRAYVSREDVAQAILEVIEAHRFVREMPILSKP